MSDWWSRKLGTSPKAPAPSPSAYPQAITPPAPEAPSPKATHQRNQGVCPGCGGDNYFSTASSRARCYDCGYPLEQQGSGLSGTTSGGTSTPARQVPSAGYQPGNIIGRVQ